MLKTSIFGAAMVAFIGTVAADSDYIQPYPELNEYQHGNYAAQPSGGQVIYDYQDQQQAYDSSGYDDGSRYKVEEKPSSYNAYYSSSDYKEVKEGTEGSYAEMGGWHYERPAHASYYQ